MEKLELIDLSGINSFSISVTEEIQSSHLLTFLRTHCENQNFLLNEQSCFYYYFHKQALKYEVIVFDKLTKNSFPKIFIFKAYPRIQNNTLFLLEDAFCLYMDGELTLFKKVEKIVEEDIKEYISQVYNVFIDKTVVIKNEEIEKLTLEFQEKFYPKEKKKVFPYKEQKSFRYFQYFLLFSTFVFFVLFYKIYTDKIDYQNFSSSIQSNEQLNFQKNLIAQYKQFEMKAPLQRLSTLFYFLNELEIKILKLEYDKSRCWIQLIHPKKEALLQLIQKRVDLETKAIYFEKNLQSHILEIDVVF